MARNPKLSLQTGALIVSGLANVGLGIGVFIYRNKVNKLDQAMIKLKKSSSNNSSSSLNNSLLADVSVCTIAP